MTTGPTTASESAEQTPLAAPMQAWLQHLQTNRRYSRHTLDGYGRDLRHLAELAVRAKLPLERIANGHIRQFIARLHAQGYKAAADLCQVVVCCDEYNFQLAQNFANGFGADATNRWQDVIERSDVDAISICMPPHQHAPIALAAAAAGKHVLVEKPMALNLAECKQMVAAANEANTVLMVGQNQRFQPEHVKIKELLDGIKSDLRAAE